METTFARIMQPAKLVLLREDTAAGALNGLRVRTVKKVKFPIRLRNFALAGLNVAHLISGFLIGSARTGV